MPPIFLAEAATWAGTAESIASPATTCMPAERASAAAMGVGQGEPDGGAGSGAGSVSRIATTGDSLPSTASVALAATGAEPTGVTRGRLSRAACRSAKPGGGPAAGALRTVGKPLTAWAGPEGGSSAARAGAGMRCAAMTGGLPEGGVAMSARRGAAGMARAPGAAPPAADLTQSRIFTSSSGTRPAKRICAEGDPRTTSPQAWKPPQERRTVSPAFTGSSDAASMPSGQTFAPSTLEAALRVATATAEGDPSWQFQDSPSEPSSRRTNWSFGIGMKKRSLAPARKHSSRCAACSRCSTATRRAPRCRTRGARACSADGSGAPGAP
ncbi:MAG TPA: hypothetical protein VI356_11125 [Myxococcales bacterium]